ncbi:MAG TPA: TlpA disulfide reductase family protein [Candidatus Sulfomarinibacteraceae bacterium]|nr:TlpA disulfide reductase family protein [Candidatus Sulfomarinibacteraceae bacterium]
MFRYLWKKQRFRSFWLLGIVVAALALLAACSGATWGPGGSPASEAPYDSHADASEAGAAQIRSTLPADFPITIYQGAGFEEGDEVLFSDLVAQGRPVVLNFYAGLCPPCRLEMPDLQATSEKYADRILLVGLDVGPLTALGTHEDGRRLIRDLEITYAAGATSEVDVLRQYEIRGMPSTYFILPDGELFLDWTGILTEDRLTELVDDMLATWAES